MDLDLIKALVVLAGPLVGFLIKSIPQNNGKGRSKGLAEMEFISSFLSFEISHRPRIIVEQAFAIHFRKKYDFDQITVVLKFLNPSKSFSLLSGARRVIELLPEGKFQYKTGYESLKQREYKKYYHYFLYYLGALPALGTIMYWDFISRYLPSTWVIHFSLIVIEFALFLFAFLNLFKETDIEDAERFMQEQDKTIRALQAGYIS